MNLPDGTSVSNSAVTAASSDRLYGVPDAEELYDDIGAAYETQIDPWSDPADPRPWVIEEWTVHPPIEHVTRADLLLDYLVESTGENAMVDESFYERLENLVHDEEVIAAAEALRTALAAKITYRVADRRVAEHTITWDDAGEPLLNGKPLYVKSEVRDGE